MEFGGDFVYTSKLIHQEPAIKKIKLERCLIEHQMPKLQKELLYLLLIKVIKKKLIFKQKRLRIQLTILNYSSSTISNYN